ncbi:uncharacterized protein HD556DRAFT_1303392 [Suillus plorans]|uniref:Uncharacterized protein n=1 Tax=Suillus plorans TaxID=116603 RepID=A0A9P7DWM6_9AGAM|nr:uncharacterized protein HD556DRAFT_1303392 [Suillus plorans]KAG1804831.1 hypothetical protein HD556DRAFT_1303392 [Suillus plorans]
MTSLEIPMNDESTSHTHSQQILSSTESTTHNPQLSSSSSLVAPAQLHISQATSWTRMDLANEETSGAEQVELENLDSFEVKHREISTEQLPLSPPLTRVPTTDSTSARILTPPLENEEQDLEEVDIVNHESARVDGLSLHDRDSLGIGSETDKKPQRRMNRKPTHLNLEFREPSPQPWDIIDPAAHFLRQEQHGVADAHEEPASTDNADADALDGSDVAIKAILQHIADGGSQDPPAGYSVNDNGSLITHNEAEVYESEVAGHAQVAEALNIGEGGEEIKEIPGFGRGQRRRTTNTFTSSTILAPAVLACQPPQRQINKPIHHTLESNTTIDEALRILKRVPLDRSTPAWPMQLGRYAQKVRRVPLLGPDFTVQGLQFNLFKNEVYGEWEEFVHLSRVAYYYNRTRNTYTGLNIRDCSQDRIDKFEAWIEVTRGRVQGDLILVAEPMRTQNVDGDVYLYYLVALEARIIGWLEPLDGLELEAQFWKHVEFFPRDFKLDRILLRQLRTELDWFHAESSTSATIFSNRETMEKIISRLASLVLVREHLKQIYVDSLVNYLDLKNFIDDFNTQNNAQITLAGVIMAIDTGFLAVQGVGTGLIAESILKGSIIFCVGCLFAGMFAQRFSEKLKSLQFAAYYLDQGMTVVIGVLSAPRFFCMMRQVNFWEKSITWSSFGFLASAFIDAQHSKPALITCACCLAVVITILSPLAWYGLRAGVTPYVHLEDD